MKETFKNTKPFEYPQVRSKITGVGGLLLVFTDAVTPFLMIENLGNTSQKSSICCDIPIAGPGCAMGFTEKGEG